MARTLTEVMASLPTEEQAAINARRDDLLAEIDTLAEVRRLVGFSQQQLAETLHMRQPTLSRMEHQTDLFVSTLRRYVEALGGNLDIVVTLPGHAPIKLKQFSEMT